MKRILIVDDRRSIRTLLASFLGEQHYSIKTAPNGAVALKKIYLEKFDLVISDIGMPVMDGIELAREMRLSKSSLISSLPLVLMSGNAAPYIKKIAVLADYFLPKPFGAKDLLSVVEKALGE